MEKNVQTSRAEADRVLVERIRTGDERAFEELVRTFGARLLHVALRIVRNEDYARDCVQEAFLSVHRSIAQFDGRAPLGAWLRKIATNAALMKLRAQRRRPEDPVDPLLPQYDRHGFRVGPTTMGSASAEELVQRAGVSARVRAAIDRLPESYRTVLLLRDIEGYSTDEAAQTLETTPGALKVRLHRARNALRNALGDLFRGD